MAISFQLRIFQRVPSLAPNAELRLRPAGHFKDAGQFSQSRQSNKPSSQVNHQIKLQTSPGQPVSSTVHWVSVFNWFFSPLKTMDFDKWDWIQIRMLCQDSRDKTLWSWIVDSQEIKWRSKNYGMVCIPIQQLALNIQMQRASTTQASPCRGFSASPIFQTLTSWKGLHSGPIAYLVTCCQASLAPQTAPEMRLRGDRAVKKGSFMRWLVSLGSISSHRVTTRIVCLISLSFSFSLKAA